MPKISIIRPQYRHSSDLFEDALDAVVQFRNLGAPLLQRFELGTAGGVAQEGEPGAIAAQDDFRHACYQVPSEKFESRKTRVRTLDEPSQDGFRRLGRDFSA